VTAYAYTTISDPNATGGTVAFGINASGQIVGYYFDGSGIGHGFLYINGSRDVVLVGKPALQAAIPRPRAILTTSCSANVLRSVQATRRRLDVRPVAAGRAERVRPKARTMRITVLNSGLPVSPSAL
jgi:probable HAF family extracellular repeat protein